MNNTDCSDSFLLEEIKNQNERAFKVLFDKYYSELVQYAMYNLSSLDAEEVVQELFVYIWSNSRVINLESNLKGYLVCAVKNRALNHIRARKNYESKCLLLYEKYRDIVYSDSNHSLWELKDELSKCLKKLSAVQRETFKLSRFTPMTNKEIAIKLNISEKTVEYRLSQVLKILKSHLLPTCITLLIGGLI